MNPENSKKKEVRTEVFTNMNEQELQTILEEEATMKESESTEQRNQDPLAGGYETAINVSVDSLVIDYHPRKNLGDLKSLMGSIKRDGLLEPLLAYEMEDGKVALIDGYRRLAAAKEFGWKEVPCVIRKKMSQRDAAHLSYVKNAERNAFDPIEIAFHLKAMMDRFGYSMRDLDLKGYGSAASISLKLKLLDVAAPVQEKISAGELSVAHGIQIAKLPTHKEQERMAKRVIDEDLTAKRTERQISRYLSKGKREDDQTRIDFPDSEIPGVYMKDSRDMSELPDGSVHLIVSSPPYNVGMEFEKGVSFEEHTEMIQGVLKECARVLSKQGIIALNVGDIQTFKDRDGKNPNSQVELMGHRYKAWLKKYGIFLTDVIIWKKRMPAWTKRPDIHYADVAHTNYKLLPNYEPVYVFRKKGERETPPEDVVLRSRLNKEEWVAWTPAVWDIKPVVNMEGHPCIYPDELCMRLIRMFSYEGDTVLDPWLGSGTTVKVARELNRVGIGYEKEPQYKEVIMKKLGTGNVQAGFEGVRKLMKEIGLSPGEEQEVRESHEEEKEETVVEHAEGQLVMVAAA
ncbi:MAG: hypothetical protein CVU57_06470 [Deltaproteobacteria bacterium HGW-Deltaproteobacteria-15]|nr:MAG: hypothetical protein CVU57_06470 [Deltaproteobacteria bacterium HGW-Deltaproteobacteria-15]